ncbi:MAG: hypothetical protein A3K59_03565 [Euryarchaeota archaeon RBG_19FT_COMBO_69_17]|nr:MAG: hypothetical protein A3K59_03565 [Euryarchaeota archaeon RBG_19FT_COMBO_69_17]
MRRPRGPARRPDVPDVALICVLPHGRGRSRVWMEAFAALVLSALVIAPAAGGTLLAREVTSWSVDMDWTEVTPGLSVLLQGTYHNVSMLFSTGERGTYRLVVQTSFHGRLGVAGLIPDLGTLTILEEYAVVQSRFVGTASLAPDGSALSRDGVLSMRAVGSVTVDVAGTSITEDANVLLLVLVRDGRIAWARIGVPLGWPFQALAP